MITAKLVIFLAITGVVSYLLGGINGAIIASTSFFKKDIRNYGSGNAG
ncbi:MAG: glycerol-3-phosphate acyltransferase, partial [Oscillospiraceae bacterium]